MASAWCSTVQADWSPRETGLLQFWLAWPAECSKIWDRLGDEIFGGRYDIQLTSGWVSDEFFLFQKSETQNPNQLDQFMLLRRTPKRW